MGFNHRKLKDQRRDAAEKEAASRRATDAQVLEDAERLITAWNERQAKRMQWIFSPTIGAAIPARYWFLWVRCPACRTIKRNRPTDIGSSPRRGGNKPRPGAVMPIMPAACPVRRARAAVAKKHRRRNARGASQAGAWGASGY